MPNIDLQLRQEDAKLVFLAIAYHLGRPGSELDPITKLPVEHGLAEVARDLQPQLQNAITEIRLIDAQLQRLLSGMLGSITELKAYPMLELYRKKSLSLNASGAVGGLSNASFLLRSRELGSPRATIVKEALFFDAFSVLKCRGAAEN